MDLPQWQNVNLKNLDWSTVRLMPTCNKKEGKIIREIKKKKKDFLGKKSYISKE